MPVKNNENPAEPSLNINQEEISLLKDGIEQLEPERRKTVVFERLMMKLNKVEKYWLGIEKAREAKKTHLAESLMDKEKKQNDG